MSLPESPFIFGGLIGGLPILIIATVAWWRRRNRYRQFESSGGTALRYCSDRRFKRWWKFFPWEGIGFLRIEAGRLLFEGHPNFGETFKVESSVEQLEFYGRRNWFRNGSLPWLRLKGGSQDYYLCVETGPLIFGAGSKTQWLFNSLRQEAQQDGSGQPATRPESKPEGGDKPQPESKERSR